jgi:Flp pilus assembly protein TadB
VPLSDHEQRILDEIEKNLLQEDPGFARKDRVAAGNGRRNVRLGVFCFVVGILGLFVFFSTQSVVVGVMAFAAMVLGIVLVVRSIGSPQSPAAFLQGSRERAGRFFSDWEDKVNERRKKD